MSENCRDFLRDILVLVAALALGLTVSWIVVSLEKPDAPLGPLEQVLHGGNR